MRASQLTLLGMVAGLAVLTGCPTPGGGNPEPPADGGPATVDVKTVDLAATAVRLAVGKTVELTATAKDLAGQAIPEADIMFRSSDVAAATVDSSGLVTGKAAGALTVTASSGTASSAPLGLAVYPDLQGVVPASGAPGTAITLTGVGFGAVQGTATVQFGSSSVAVTSWSATSIVLAVPSLTAGTTSVTVTVAGQSSVAFPFEVKVGPAASVEISAASSRVAVGKTLQLTATAKDALGQVATGATFTFAPSDTALATANAAGLVSGVSAGAVTFTATSGLASSAALALSVFPDLVAVTPTSGPPGAVVAVTGHGFGAAQGTSTVKFGTTASVVTAWNDTSISATVPTLSGGSSPVTVTVAAQASDSSPFTVTPVATVELTGPAAKVIAGKTLQLTAVAKDSGGNVLAVPITFETSAATVATVSPGGLVSGLSAGSVQITARSGGIPSTPLALGVAPDLQGATPSAGPVGTTVTLSGVGFGTAAGTVLFGSDAATVEEWTDTAIVATVAVDAPGSAPVTVAVAGNASDPVGFTLTGEPSITSFHPAELAPGIRGPVRIQGHHLDGTTSVDFLKPGGAVDSAITVAVVSSTATEILLDVTADLVGGARTLVVHTAANGDSTGVRSAHNEFLKMRRTGGLRRLGGTGTAGYAGDNGPVSAAQFNAPRGLAVSSDMVFIADSLNHCVRGTLKAGGPASRLLPTGVRVGRGQVVTIAGTCGTAGNGGDGGSMLAAQLENPAALAYDSVRGLLFIADADDHRVRVANLGTGPQTLDTLTLGPGDLSTLVGTGTAGSGANELNSPQGLFLDANGVLFIADTLNGMVRALLTQQVSLPPLGGVTIQPFALATVAGNGVGTPVPGPALSSPLGEPVGVALLPQNQLAIADKASAKVLVVNLDAASHSLLNGSLSVGAGSLDVLPTTGTVLGAPTGLAYDGVGGLYVTDPSNSRVYGIALGMAGLYAGGGGGAGGAIGAGGAGSILGGGSGGDFGSIWSSALGAPSGIAFWDNHIYYCDSGSSTFWDASVGYTGNPYDGFHGTPAATAPGCTLSTDDGTFTCGTNVTYTGVSDGIFSFQDFIVAAGDTVNIVGTQRAFIMAAGTIAIHGTLDITGNSSGIRQGCPLTCGTCSASFATGPSGGSSHMNTCCSPFYSIDCSDLPPATYGTPELATMTGGAAVAWGLAPTGALLLAAQGSITVDGSIVAKGAVPIKCNSGGPTGTGGSSSGGAVKLVSLGGDVTLTGSIDASGGGPSGGTYSTCITPPNYCGQSYSFTCGPAGDGRIRIEASGAVTTAGATVLPAASIAASITPVVSLY